MEDEAQREIQKAVVLRLIKKALPEGISVAKDSKLAFTKAATIFVQYLAAAANDQVAKKSIVQSKHVLAALDELELSQFKDPLEEALKEFQELQKSKKKQTSKKEGSESTSKPAAATTTTTTTQSKDVDMEETSDD